MRSSRLEALAGGGTAACMQKGEALWRPLELCLHSGERGAAVAAGAVQRTARRNAGTMARPGSVPLLLGPG